MKIVLLYRKCMKNAEKCNGDFQTYMVQYWLDAGM